MRSLARQLIVILPALFLCACVNLPVHNDTISDPALLEISKAFEETVQTAHNDPDVEWQSGWLGNMWVHFSDRPQRGLCYEWKYLVHAGVADTVEKVGWQIRGIAVNEKTDHEHHAVLVFDPRNISEAEILTAKQNAPVYVLDAWRQGRADIFTISSWLNSNYKIDPSPRVFPMPATDYSTK